MTTIINQGRLALPEPLGIYCVDADGMVWRSGKFKRRTRLRRGGQPVRTANEDQPLNAVTLCELRLRMGESRSHRDKVCIELIPGIWQIRPMADAQVTGARAPWWNSWRPSTSMAEANHRCWFEIVLRPNRPRPDSTRGLSIDSRNHFPFIIMGKMAFGEISKQSQ